MPLTKKGRLILKSFKQKYGQRNGRHVFMGWLNQQSKEEIKKYEKTNNN